MAGQRGPQHGRGVCRSCRARAGPGSGGKRAPGRRDRARHRPPATPAATPRIALLAAGRMPCLGRHP
eukprot:11161712-Lingulodinium_polyedra.AAC.1